MELLHSFGTIKSSRLKCKMEFIFGKATLIMKASLSNLPQIGLGTDSFPSLTLKGGALFRSESHHNSLFSPVNFNTRNVLQGILRHFLLLSSAVAMFPRCIWYVLFHLACSHTPPNCACSLSYAQCLCRAGGGHYLKMPRPCTRSLLLCNR